MAEPQSTQEAAIVPARLDDGYTISINRFSASGANPGPIVVHIPADAKLASIRDNPLFLAAVLKDGDPVWRQFEFSTIFAGVLYANSLGLDILQGDVYNIEGRFAVSDKAKIKYALRQNLFTDAPSIVTTVGPEITIKYRTKNGDATWTGPDLTTTVELHVKGWSSPLVYTTSLRAWFKGSNPNWRDNPQGMLEMRAYAKACERVCPVGGAADEAPPLEVPDVASKLTQVKGQS